MKKSVEYILALTALIGIFWGSYRYIDTTYAKAGEMQQLEQRLDHKILSDQLYEIQKRRWTLEDRYAKGKEMPATVKEEYRLLKKKEEELKTQLEK